MFETVEQQLKKLTVNTKRWTTQILESIATLQNTLYKDVPKEVNLEQILLDNIARFEYILESQLIDAISSHKEYKKLDVFRINLMNIFRRHSFEILKPFLLHNDMERTISAMNYYAGDIDEFYAGVLYAREVLAEEAASEGKAPRDLSPAQKAAYWRKFVWGTAKYVPTIELRFESWGEKAPYWIFLEEGNFNHQLAYPRFNGTHFFYLSIIQCRDLFNKLYLDAKQQLESPDTINTNIIIDTVIVEAIQDFLNNFDYYKPGDIITRFYNAIKGREYEIYVTKTKRLGTRIKR